MARSSASIRFVLGVIGLNALGFGLVVPVMPSLVEQVTGRSGASAAAVVGSLFAAFSVVQFFCSSARRSLAR